MNDDDGNFVVIVVVREDDVASTTTSPKRDKGVMVWEMLLLDRRILLRRTAWMQMMPTHQFIM
jgi:hypothetical protein